MYQQALAILWAQWRSLFNRLRGKGGGNVVPVLVTCLWYLAWVTAGIAIAAVASNPQDTNELVKVVPSALFLMVLYWQLIPVLMASTGSSLDLKKLRPYPIPHSQLFGVEVLLRLSTGGEVLILLAGFSFGLLMNPGVPAWGPLLFAPFIVFNMLMSAGIRDLVGRLLARRRMREILMIVFLTIATVPQLVAVNGLPAPIRRALMAAPLDIWPWTATAKLVYGRGGWLEAGVIAGWTLFAFWFGRAQFERTLRFDVDAAASTSSKPARGAGLIESIYRLPSRLLPDPLGAIVEKEIRFLSRTPRFRLVFLMGFTFGLVVWLPIAGRAHGGGGSLFSSHYLSFVSLYALMLLGEVSFWNALGFDRSAVQIYFITPVKFSTVLVAKNITTAAFVFLEIVMICTVCWAFRMPIALNRLVEAFGVASVMAVFLMAVGNIGTVRGPRPVNPGQAWRSAASRVQAMLLLVYPIGMIPIGLAFLAGYAFHSDLALYGVLLFDLCIGAVVYWVALESAVGYVETHRELLISTLSQGEGPINS